MKNSMLKVIIAIVAVFAVNQLVAKEMKEVRQELRKNIDNYKTTNIIPQMNTWKSDIDKNIKSEDLTKLNQLREKAYNLKLESRKNMKAKTKGAFKKDRPERKKADNSDLKKNEMKEIGKELKTIIKNNKVYFDKLFADSKPIMRNWRDDIEDIMDKWQEDNEDLIEAAKEKNKGKSRPIHPKMDGMVGGKQMAAARILLYNGKLID